MTILELLIIIGLLGFIISIPIWIFNDNDFISNISAIFGIIFLIFSIMLSISLELYNNRIIDKTNSHCLNLKLIDGSSTIECFDLSDKQMENLNIYSNDGSYWLITSPNKKSIFIQYQTKLKPAIIDFHIIN